MFGKPGFVVDVRGDQCELLPFSQDAQQQDDGATATLPHTIVHHPAGEWQWLQRHTTVIWLQDCENQLWSSNLDTRSMVTIVRALLH